MSEFKPINTQEEFDTVIKARLERERAKYADYDDIKAKAAQFDGVQTKLTAATAEIDKLKGEAKAAADKLASHDKTVADLTDRATKAERSLLRRKVAEDAKLPPFLADRLTGETEEDLRKDAEALAKYVQIPTPTPLATIERPYTPGSPEAKEAAINDAFRGVLQTMRGDI